MKIQKNKKGFPAEGISIVDGFSEISNEKHMATGRMDYLEQFVVLRRSVRT